MGMADYAFNRITAALNSQKQAVNGSRVLILGKLQTERQRPAREPFGEDSGVARRSGR